MTLYILCGAPGSGKSTFAYDLLHFLLFGKTKSGKADSLGELFNNYLPNENEVKVGNALVELLRNWEEVLPNGGSNKLQKSSVLYFLREETMMTTK